jgi:hypothetical protein
VVAHGRDVGLRCIGQLAERHAIFAPFSDQVQGGVQEARPRPQTGLATLVRSRSFHCDLFNQMLETGQASACWKQILKQARFPAQQ